MLDHTLGADGDGLALLVDHDERADREEAYVSEAATFAAEPVLDTAHAGAGWWRACATTGAPSTPARPPAGGDPVGEQRAPDPGRSRPCHQSPTLCPKRTGAAAPSDRPRHQAWKPSPRPLLRVRDGRCGGGCRRADLRVACSSRTCPSVCRCVPSAAAVVHRGDRSGRRPPRVVVRPEDLRWAHVPVRGVPAGRPRGGRS